MNFMIDAKNLKQLNRMNAKYALNDLTKWKTMFQRFPKFKTIILIEVIYISRIIILKQTTFTNNKKTFHSAQKSDTILSV